MTTLYAQGVHAQTLVGLLPTAKRYSCGLRVHHLCLTQLFDAPDDEGLDQLMLWIDEVDNLVMLLLFTEFLRPKAVLEKPGSSRLPFSQVSQSTMSTLGASSRTARSSKAIWS